MWWPPMEWLGSLAAEWCSVHAQFMAWSLVWGTGVQAFHRHTSTLLDNWTVAWQYIWNGPLALGWMGVVKSRVRAITSSWMQQTQVEDGRGKATSLGGVEGRNYEDVYSWRGGIIAKRVKHARKKQKTVNRKRHFVFLVSPTKSLNYYNS